jgi:hypothetical protein
MVMLAMLIGYEINDALSINDAMSINDAYDINDGTS